MSTHRDTLGKWMLCLERSAVYLAGGASITCSDWLSTYVRSLWLCVGVIARYSKMCAGPYTLWLCGGVTACCSQFGLGQP